MDNKSKVRHAGYLSDQSIPRTVPTNAVEMSADIAQLFGFIAGKGYNETEEQRELLRRSLAVVELN